MAAYCSRAGIESFVFCSEDTPEVNILEIAFQGAKVWKANGLIHECGTGLIGMWTAFNELVAIGWIGSERSKMIAVHAAGCAPIVRVFKEDARHAEPYRGNAISDC